MLKVSVLIVSCAFISSTSAVLPDFIQPCHRNDPAVSKCLLNNANALKPYFRTGIPEYNIPPLEPLILSEIRISRDTGASVYKIIGRNVNVHGVSNFQISKLKIDTSNLIVFLSIKFPFLEFAADVDVDARILLVPIRGKGYLEANATGVSGNAILKAEVVNDNGVNKLYFKQLDLDLNTEHIEAHMKNLFGDELLGQMINEAVSQNGHQIWNVIKPVAEETAGEIILDTINKISDKFSYDELFPA